MVVKRQKKFCWKIERQDVTLSSESPPSKFEGEEIPANKKSVFLARKTPIYFVCLYENCREVAAFRRLLFSVRFRV